MNYQYFFSFCTYVYTYVCIHTFLYCSCFTEFVILMSMNICTVLFSISSYLYICIHSCTIIVLLHVWFVICDQWTNLSPFCIWDCGFFISDYFSLPILHMYVCRYLIRFSTRLHHVISYCLPKYVRIKLSEDDKQNSAYSILTLTEKRMSKCVRIKTKKVVIRRPPVVSPRIERTYFDLDMISIIAMFWEDCISM
jgi:hypothetical protein